MSNIVEQRDFAQEFWTNTTSPLAAAVTRGPVFFCADMPHRGPIDWVNAGSGAVARQVRGPAVDCWLKVPTASAGSLLELYGSEEPSFAFGFTVFSAAVVAAAGIYQLPALLASAMASAPKTFNSPFPFWRFSFINGASNQAAGFCLAVRGGGWT